MFIDIQQTAAKLGCRQYKKLAVIKRWRLL